jgi:hypothetical protein
MTGLSEMIRSSSVLALLLMRSRSTGRTGPQKLMAYPQLAEKRHHRTPVGECGLKEIEANENSEKKPMWAHRIPKPHTEHHEKPGNQTQITFDVHANRLL